MPPEADENLWDSAFDFKRVVLQVVRRWLPPGVFLTVEGEGEQPALKVVDTVAGIDSWYVSGDTRLQGIACRVQYGEVPFESFTIRSRLPSGAPTELGKRLDALARHDEHFVVPQFTVQAWVERRRTGRPLMVLLVRTQDLFSFVVEHPEKVEHRRNPEDGTEFLVVWADDLRAAGIRVEAWYQLDMAFRLRDGQWWQTPSPEEMEQAEAEAEATDEADEEGEVYAWWDECDYPTAPGDMCPMCGDIHWP